MDKFFTKENNVIDHWIEYLFSWFQKLCLQRSRHLHSYRIFLTNLSLRARNHKQTHSKWINALLKDSLDRPQMEHRGVVYSMWDLVCETPLFNSLYLYSPAFGSKVVFLRTITSSSSWFDLIFPYYLRVQCIGRGGESRLHRFQISYSSFL